MCSTVSTSPGFAVFAGAAALEAEGAVDCGDGCGAALWALALHEARPRQTVKTLVVSFLMATNLTAFEGSCKLLRLGRNALP